MHLPLRPLFFATALWLFFSGNAVPITAPQTSYRFTGTCSDCTGTGTGTLVLTGYTLGTPLSNSNFVSFNYSSNLVTFTLLASDNPDVSGSLPATLPGQSAVFLIGPNNKILNTRISGGQFWCAGASCSADFGTSFTWSFLGSTTTTAVPTLSDWSMATLAIALAVMGSWLLKRLQTRSAN